MKIKKSSSELHGLKEFGEALIKLSKKGWMLSGEIRLEESKRDNQIEEAVFSSFKICKQDN